jgi:tRNA A37 methylthiotransferase MiaB
MKRPYNIDEIKKKIEIIHKYNKKIMINTHVIVGFPNETEEDFNETRKILETGLFDRVKVFMYSKRPNTEASTFDNEISDEVKMGRREILLKVIRKQNFKKFSLVNFILNKEQLK